MRNIKIINSILTIETIQFICYNQCVLNNCLLAAIEDTFLDVKLISSFGLTADMDNSANHYLEALNE